jgi:hypothetical protein
VIVAWATSIVAVALSIVTVDPAEIVAVAVSDVET